MDQDQQKDEELIKELHDKVWPLACLLGHPFVKDRNWRKNTKVLLEQTQALQGSLIQRLKALSD